MFDLEFLVWLRFRTVVGLESLLFLSYCPLSFRLVGIYIVRSASLATLAGRAGGQFQSGRTMFAHLM